MEVTLDLYYSQLNSQAKHKQASSELSLKQEWITDNIKTQRLAWVINRKEHKITEKTKMKGSIKE